MTISLPVFISTIVGVLTITSVLIAVGINIGSFRYNYMLKQDCENKSSSCNRALHNEIKTLDEKFSKQFEVMQIKMSSVEEKFNDKNNRIFDEMEQIRLDIVKLQTLLIGFEKRFDGVHHG